MRSMVAMLRKMPEIITWPDEHRKQVIKQQIRTQNSIPHCLGFIDGTPLIKCCFMLHNLCFNSWELFVDRDQFSSNRPEDPPQERDLVEESRYENMRELYRRREKLVDQIIEIDDDLDDETFESLRSL
jgi:hypothetical protein